MSRITINPATAVRTYSRMQFRPSVTNPLPPKRIQCIYLPREFYPATIQMTKSPVEIRGVLLCDQLNNGSLMVGSIVTLGSGTAYNVRPDENKFKAAALLLGIDRSIVAVDFHVHVEATGVTYYDKFSAGDYTAFDRIVNEQYDGYKHICFTPDHVLVFGLHHPTFCVIDGMVGMPNKQFFARYEELADTYKTLVKLQH